MVTKTEINSRVESGLHALIAEIDWLPNTAAEEAQPIFERLNLYRPTVSLDIPSTTAAG
ncbi:MAG TPA: hypothetical protein VIG44_12970 [Thermomicrobiales bacterium]|jgi:hypothetical protein